eukprot:CAMPEP_0172484036 /NCGR_PEP_ID=MMETSP1066-20121228/11300_1 /TAXON_ID=671091 /ORGANISM="Coscinodiscus wailesii, Strain CCMP2513" /LENGTH=143 /DNA_ID=CAMNT_0013248285 /DNA_START=35 /DNA_END=463 /DNA_ORIENTATION=+
MVVISRVGLAGASQQQQQQQQQQHRRAGGLPLPTILSIIIILPLSFYVGTMTGAYVSNNSGSDCDDGASFIESRVRALVEAKVKEELKRQSPPDDTAAAAAVESRPATPTRTRFPPTISNFAKGAVRVKKGPFFAAFDFGNPR